MPAYSTSSAASKDCSLSYKSFCWSMGTTSYRTVHFNFNIERQLQLMEEFRALPGNQGRLWRDLQTEYYRHMKKSGFVKGDAPIPDKDAREKTSGLVDIGLMDPERSLTEVGRKLLELSRKGDFSSQNLLQLPEDSFLYLKQLMKSGCWVDGSYVRPFLVTLYALTRLDFLTQEEFAYLIPLCVSRESTETVIQAILRCREGKDGTDSILLERLFSLEQYQAALSRFLEGPVTETLLCEVGMNRKSKSYDKSYFPFYTALVNLYRHPDASRLPPLLAAADRLSGSPGALWKKYLFRSRAKRTMEKEGLNILFDRPLWSAGSERAFQEEFFRLLHLFKAKSTLHDYFDLNRRYFRLSDALLFVDGKVEMDLLPGCLFRPAADSLLSQAFEPSPGLDRGIALESILPGLDTDAELLYGRLGRELGEPVRNRQEAEDILRKRRYRRLSWLLDHRFSLPVLLQLLDCFESRNDEIIHNLVTDNADIPTIFEYILGLCWYLISGRKGDVLEHMNLSLEADLLPKTHAAGGSADITYWYPASGERSSHWVLLEATLSEKNNQRRMEMEPVSRHLGDFILKTGEAASYAVLVTPYLDINVISDFRNRRSYQYFSQDRSQRVRGLKILPLSTRELKRILQCGLSYGPLYALFEQAFRSNTDVAEWYEREIADKLPSG